MPWSSLENVPDNVKTHDGAALTLAQANYVANIADSAEGDEPWAIAWAQFKKKYKKDGDKWVTKKSENVRPVIIPVLLDASKLDIDADVMDVEACIEFKRGDVEITEKVFDEIITNFDTNAVGRDVYIDIRHLSENPDQQKNAFDNISLGTVKYFKKGASEHPDAEGKVTLIAGIEWNKTGRESIENGEFRYLSLTYYPVWEHVVTGELVGATATSIACTNDPYAPFLKPIGDNVKVAASRIVIEKGLPRELTAEGGHPVKKKKKIELQVSTEDLRSNLESAISDAIEGTDVYVWIKDIELDEGMAKGTAIYSYQGELKGRDFSLAEDGSVILDGEAFEVTQSTKYVKKEEAPVPEPPAEEPVVTDTDSQGGPEMDEKEKEELTRQKAEAETKVVELARQVKELRQSNSLARRRKLFSHVTRPIDGKVLPAVAREMLENILLGDVGKDGKPVTLTATDRILGIKKMFQVEGETETAVEAAPIEEVVAELEEEIAATEEAIVEADIPEEVKETELDVLRAQVAALVEQIRALGAVPVTQESTQESVAPAEGASEELTRLSRQILAEKKEAKLFDAEGKPRFSERKMQREAQLIAEKRIMKGGK